jgi:hypothetical protein
MRIAWAVFSVSLLGLPIVAQAPQTAPEPTGTLPATGHVLGLVTAAKLDSVTIRGLQDGKPATRTYGIRPDTAVFVVPPTSGEPTKMAYKEVWGGDLKKFAWYADNPSLTGKAAELTAKEGVAVEARLFAACTRERCESPECKRKCKAPKCACPQD